MKKTISINLNGILFNIDDDAYNLLEEYLHKIELHFSGQSEAKEILSDIESRIAELLTERSGGAKKVISTSDIEEVIKIMGNPDDFGEQEQKENKSHYTSYRQKQKRIYRDPENRILGGICGGMGLYVNVDPIIFRIIFVVAFLGFGVGLLIYILLWIIIPEAKTTAQKLEMRGDPVNVSNIGNFFKEEFENVKNSFKGKKKS